MLRKKIRLHISLFIIMLLACSQFMIVTYACSLQSLVTGTQARMTASLSPDCVDMKNVSSPFGDQPSPLCLAHCEQTSQSHQVSVSDLPSANLVVLFETHPVNTHDLLFSTLARPPLLFLMGSSPPRRIQYQVFRI